MRYFDAKPQPCDAQPIAPANKRVDGLVPSALGFSLSWPVRNGHLDLHGGRHIIMAGCQPCRAHLCSVFRIVVTQKIGTMKPQNDDITTFSGFGSWMSTFTPQPAPGYDEDYQATTYQQRDIHELDNHYHDYHELDAGSMNAVRNKHHIAELPDHHRVPQPYPPQPYPPQPINRGPLPYPVYPVYPEPTPAPAPYPDYKPNPKPRPAPVVNKKKDLETKRIVILDVPDPVCRVEVRGLQKVGQKGLFTEVVSLSSFGFLDDIAEKLRSFGNYVKSESV